MSSRSKATLIDELLIGLRNKKRHLAQIAMDDGTPIDEIGPLIDQLLTQKSFARQFKTAKPEVIVERAEHEINNFLSEMGFEPVRHKEGNIPPLDGVFLKTIYVRTAEYTLFEAVDRGDPVVLATSAEPRRFAKALIQKYGSLGKGRPIFIWTSGSGIFQVIGSPPNAEYRKLASDRASVSNLSHIVLRKTRIALLRLAIVWSPLDVHVLLQYLERIWR